MIHHQYQIEEDETAPLQDLRERSGTELGAPRGPGWKDPEPKQSCVRRFRCPDAGMWASAVASRCRHGLAALSRASPQEPPTQQQTAGSHVGHSFKDQTGTEQQTNDTDSPSSSRFRGLRARCARQERLFRLLCLHRYRPVVFLRVTVATLGQLVSLVQNYGGTLGVFVKKS